MTEPLEIQKFLEKPEDFPEYLHRTKDFQMGIEIWNYVNKVSIAASVVKATILYAMKREWVPAEHEGEQFHDYIVRMTGQNIATVQYKIEQGEMLGRVPPKYLSDIQAKETKIKNVIVDVVLDGKYEIKDEQWDKIARAESYQDAADVVREIKKVEPRKQWLKFTHDEHGIIWVHTAEGVFEYARINNDPVIQDVIEKASKRLFRAGNIMPKVRY